MMLTKKLSEPKILWISFLATLLITLAFQVIMQQLDLILLDGISDPMEVKAAIAAMSEYQRHFHAWVTATLDVAYPVAYGALFIGSAYRFFPFKGFPLALPAMACIPVDLAEGVVQVLALTGTADLVGTKAVLTPLKQLLFVCGFLITIAGWMKWSIDRVRGAA